MSDQRISQLAAAATLDGDELVPVVQDGDNAAATVDQLRAAKLPAIATGAGTLVAGSFQRADATAGAFPLTLPAAASCAGQRVDVKKVDGSAYVVTVTADGAELIDGEPTYPLEFLGEFVGVMSDGAAWRVVAE